MNHSKENTAPQSALTPYRANRKGFSLVEIVLAVGIVSFAFLTILGLLPTGLRTFTSAIESSVGGQILQRVINEAQQTDFDTLVDRSNLPSSPPADYTFRAPTVTAAGWETRYFDNQANESVDTTTGKPLRTGTAIYCVNTRIKPSTTLVATNALAATNINLATITVQIAKNPGNVTLPMTNNLWPNTTALPVITYSTMVSRNK